MSVCSWCVGIRVRRDGSHSERFSFSWRIDRVLGVLMVSGVQFIVGVSGFNFDVGLMPDVSGL